MIQYLPYGGFKWVSTDIDFNVGDDSQVGYILEVDLNYTSHLHDEHKDLPFYPEQRKPPGAKDWKLLTTFYPKLRYIIHYKNLKQALKSGLKLVKTMENIRKHVDIKLVSKWDGRYGVEVLVTKPNFRSRSIFYENLAAIELSKVEVLLNKPVYKSVF